MINLSNENFVVQDGERIAQLVFAEVNQAQWEETIELTDTKRGTGGFGSTGIK